jgi:DNA-directed RNA polymerase-5 subunit 1
MKTVAKRIIKDHLVPMADSMMSIGIKKRFNNAGYKATFRPLKVQVSLTKSNLFTPMKCMRRLQRDAILIHWDVWSLHVRGVSMQYLAPNHLLKFCNENQLKSNKEYDDSLYAKLTLVRTDQEKARYTFLGDVQQPGRLLEQNGIMKQP